MNFIIFKIHKKKVINYLTEKKSRKIQKKKIRERMKKIHKNEKLKNFDKSQIRAIKITF